MRRRASVTSAPPGREARRRDPGRRAVLRAGQSGFGLTELMVSMALIAVVLAGSFRAFDDARRASEMGAMLVDGSQNLRMAVVLITRDAMQTGRELPNGGIPIPKGPGVAPIKRPGPPGGVLTLPANWTTLPAICPGNGLGPRVNNVPTDIVSVLYADATLPLNEYPLTNVRSDGSRMTVDNRTSIADPRSGIRPGDLILFTNSMGNAIQTVTSVTSQYVYFAAGDANDAFGFNQRTATSGSIMQIRSGTAFPTTSATRVSMVTYYLDTTTAADQSRLMRQEAFQPPRLIGQGIENVQLTYDIVDGSTNPTNQVDAVSPYSPSQIRKMNLFLASRSDQQLQQTGRRVRSSISTQVTLRSMSFMDRYR
jgi:prepilin-type N-terminal cleavage/methylation domain-containing protein